MPGLRRPDDHLNLLFPVESDMPDKTSLVRRVVARHTQVIAGKIQKIEKAYIRKYTDNDTEKAYIEWIDDKGKKGRTEGDPDSPHIKALLDRAKREGVKVKNEKWASISVQAGDMPDAAFERMVGAVEKNAKDMLAQVKRLGGVKAALEQGHAETLKQQLTEISSAVRTLQRRLGE